MNKKAQNKTDDTETTTTARGNGANSLPGNFHGGYQHICPDSAPSGEKQNRDGNPKNEPVPPTDSNRPYL